MRVNILIYFTYVCVVLIQIFTHYPLCTVATHSVLKQIKEFKCPATYVMH